MKNVGIFISANGQLGGSPDGMVTSQSRIVEVKCPWSARHMTFEELTNKKDYCLNWSESGVTLKPDHEYYHQVQGCMHLANVDECDFVVWTTACTLIVKVQRELLWQSNVDILCAFFTDHMVPLIIELN